MELDIAMFSCFPVAPILPDSLLYLPEYKVTTRISGGLEKVLRTTRWTSGYHLIIRGLDHGAWHLQTGRRGRVVLVSPICVNFEVFYYAAAHLEGIPRCRGLSLRS